MANMNYEHRFTYATELILRDGGWFEGRSGFFNPPTSTHTLNWKSFPLAEMILGEFSGLTIGKERRGIEKDSHRIRFGPEFPWSFYEYGQRYKNLYGKLLYPLGEMSAPYIFIDEEEFVVTHYFVKDEMAIIGYGFDSVLEKLLLGYGDLYKPCPL